MFETLKTQHKNAYAKKHIFNDGQLLRRTPIRYHDYSHTTKLSDLAIDEKRDIAVLANIKSIDEKISNGKKMTVVKACDEEGTPFTVTYMNRNQVASWLSAISGHPVLFTGEFKNDRIFKYTCFNPEFTDKPYYKMRILPVYHKNKGISERMYISHLTQCLKECESETLTTYQRGNYPDIMTAFQQIYYPATMDDPAIGERRLILDDLIYFEAMMEMLSPVHSSPFILSKHDEMDNMIEQLPFALTGDQRKTIDGIVRKMQSGSSTHALVQGDVGCGKTIVAFALMKCAAENGYQSILMAPTQILAAQHYKELITMVPESEVAFFDGTLKDSVKKKQIQGIESGQIHYIIGTSALLFADISFDNVAVSIVDEEHRFGVLQRDHVFPDGTHTIIMSATPIPRSLASAIYGDNMNIYQIVEKPSGRKPIITAYDDGKLVNNTVLHMLQKWKYQVYIVCPLKEEADEESTMNGIQSAEEVYAYYQKFLHPYEFTVGCVTGDTKASDKEAILNQFKNGHIDVLVSTTVIEVGINVPNANAIIIMNAERFGLATLHQLRGRVGRGDKQAFCLLVSKERNYRIDAMLNTDDGFKIAEADLLERRSGDLLGLKQSGKNKFIEEMLAYPDIMQDAKRILGMMKPEEVERHIQKYKAIYPIEIE